MCQKIVEPEPTLPVCPKCGKEIEYLYCYDQKRSVFDGENYDGEEYVEDSTNFECPECSEVLFTDEEEARKFLKG